MLNQCLFKNIEIASHKMSNFLWICYNVNNQLLCLRMPCIYSKHSLCLRIFENGGYWTDIKMEEKAPTEGKRV